MTFFQLTPHASKWPREIEMGFKIKTKWALLDLFIRVQAPNKKLKFPGGGEKGKRRGRESVAGDGQVCHFMLIISGFKKMSCR